MNATQFNRLPRRKQRLLIAKDILERVRRRQFQPRNLVWVSPLKEAKYRESVQEYVNAGKPCHVCALGGIMASFAGFANEINFTKTYYGEVSANFQSRKTRSRLSKIFGKEMLRDIEFTFEDGEGLYSVTEDHFKDFSWAYCATGSPTANKLLKFRHRYRSTRGVFRAMFKNIIRNKGDFIVP